ncbi:MAG: hypothetical protein OWU33_05905 [Firmicutes bacterium]|nr:hypothetical protein [Bacillota bacterium]
MQPPMLAVMEQGAGFQDGNVFLWLACGCQQGLGGFPLAYFFHDPGLGPYAVQPGLPASVTDNSAHW